MARKSNILVARVSYLTTYEGKRVRIIRGKTTAHANHPVVQGHEDKWRAVNVDYPVDNTPDTRDESPAPKKSPGRPKKQAEPSPEPKAVPKAEPKVEAKQPEKKENGEVNG